MKLSSSLLGQTAIYGASSIIGRFLNYLLVPLYTAVFVPGEYGVVTELYAYVAFLNVLLTYGLETAFFRFATRTKDIQRYFNITQSSILVTTVVAGFTLLTFSKSLAVLIDYPNQVNMIRWVILIIMIDALVALPFSRLRLENKAVKFASLKLMSIGVNISLNLFFFLILPNWGFFSPKQSIGVEYVFIANLIANALFLPFFIPDLRNFKFKISKDLKSVLVYAFPLLFMGLAGVTNEMLSRALLKYILPVDFYSDQTKLEALGVFGACYKLSVFMTLAVQAFRYASEPFFFNKASSQNSPELFSKVMHGFIIFGGFSWLFISLVLNDIAPIFLRQPLYLSGLHIVPWLLGGGVFLGIYFNLSVWYKLTDKTHFGAWISVLGALVTLLLNVLLIPSFGYLGSAMVTFIVYFLMSVASFFIGQKHLFIPYHVHKGLFYLILAGLLILAFYFWGLNSGSKYLIMISFLTIYLLPVYFMDIRSGFFSKDQL